MCVCVCECVYVFVSVCMWMCMCVHVEGDAHPSQEFLFGPSLDLTYVAATSHLCLQIEENGIECPWKLSILECKCFCVGVVVCMLKVSQIQFTHLYSLVCVHNYVLCICHWRAILPSCWSWSGNLWLIIKIVLLIHSVGMVVSTPMFNHSTWL